jgi:hypothetical protein
MDRAVPADPPPDVLPPYPWDAVRRLLLMGVGLNLAAAVLGLVASDVPAVTTARLLLVFAGTVLVGVGVSARPDSGAAWGLGALAAFVGIAGLPAHWDDFRLLLGVLTLLAASGAVLQSVPRAWRLRALTIVLLFHFGGIFMATTAPTPTPWLNEQVFSRIYNPYLQFLYLRNAYHFYSPDPGPASLIFCLLRTETGEERLADGTKQKTYSYKWVIHPKRPEDVKDPLGLSYYRRLALAEHIARATPAAALPLSFEQNELSIRRRETPIPMMPNEPAATQYRLPLPDLMRVVVPSYAQHVILDHTPNADAARKTTVKIYRVEHRTLGVGEFIRGNGPYHPSTYRPHFIGEFDVFGALVDPQERMLYWLVPVLARTGPGADPKQKSYVDYLSAHALGVRVEDLDKPENAANALNWDSLR